MRRLSTWILILALILLVICVLWLLPRLLEPPPAPVTDIASAEATAAPVAIREDQGAPANPPGGPPSGRPPEEGGSSAPAPTELGNLSEDLSAPGKIVGRVVDSAGRGVAGATVLAAHAPDLGAPIEEESWWIAHLPLDVQDPGALGAEAPARTATDEEGRFAFEDFEAGRVRLAVRSPRTDPLDLNDLWLASGSTLSFEKLRVAPATVLSGRIFDPDGRPILGATIARVDDFFGAGIPRLSAASGVLLGETNGRGHFRTQPVGPGPWSILVSGGSGTSDLPIARGSAQAGFELEASMERSVRIAGRVRSSMRAPRDLVVRALPMSASPSPSQSPSPSPSQSSVPFVCRADARESVVRPNLKYELADLAPGTVYELRASERSRAFEVDSAWSPPVFAIAGDDRADLAWEPDASVTFRVVAAGSREPLPSCGAVLTGLDPERADVAGPSAATLGLSTIEGLRPRRSARFLRLRLAQAGFLPVEQDLADIRPAYALALGDLELFPIPTMRVRVVDARSKDPIEGARVVAIENPSSLEQREPEVGAPTNQDGEARIHSFGGTASGILVRAHGYAPARRYGPFGGGFSEASFEIGLFRGATVTVRAVDAAGEPIAGARIEHVEGNWSPNESWRDGEAFEIGERPDPRASRIADVSGAVIFRNVAPGRHAFRVRRYRSYLDGEWSLRELREGESAEVVLVSQAPATLHVRVRDEGTALVGAPVALLRQEDVPDLIALLDARTPLPPGIDARLDELGAAIFANLAPGWYFLAVGVAGQGVRAIREVNVAEGGGRLEIDVARRSIVGTVADPEGEPVAGAEIHLLAWGRRPRDRSPSALNVLGTLWDPEVFANGLEIAATTADEDGRYRILGLPKSERFVVIARAGAHWSGVSAPVHLGADDLDTTASVSLAPAGAIEVQVATRPGILPCVLAAVSRELRTNPRVRRIVSGRSEVFPGLAPGTWEVLLDAGDLGRRHERIEVVAGETAIVELALP